MPLDVRGNKKQLQGVKTLSDFQSTLDILINPIEGYPYPGVDIIGGLDELSDRLDDGSYNNEYDFQIDLFKLIQSARDQHYNYNPDITSSIFGFSRSISLLSLSKDGTELPQIYSYLDLPALTSSNRTNYTASPIAKINGQPAEDHIRGYADANGAAQDPDANFNTALFNVPWAQVANAFATSTFYQGNETVYTFQNGTTRHEPNYAVTLSDFTGVKDGATFFAKFCAGDAPPLLTAANATNMTSSVYPSASASASLVPVTTNVPFSAVPSQTAFPAPNGYPSSWITTPDYRVSCYFPASQPDLTVLSIPDFHPDTAQGQLDFTNAVRACLATAQSKTKKRLIIDLRGNGGGVVFLAYDLFKQLFPSKTPYGATNFRAFPLFNDVGEIITEEYEDVSPFNRTRADFVNGYSSIFNANEGLDARLDDYDSWAEFYGPVAGPEGAEFTHLLRYNLSDAYQLSGSTVSGYGNLTDITPAQVFDADNIVLLQDGICASTCAVFAEFMKAQGHVQQIVMGGQAQKGPMQAVGGVKGANVYGADYLSELVQEAYKVAPPARRDELEAEYAAEIETFPYAMQRVARDPTTGESGARVNVRNNIRLGDENLTPLQFVYEAADCRLWYTAGMIVDQGEVWEAAYQARWGGGGNCVEGSTGQVSSGFGVEYIGGGDAGRDGDGGLEGTEDIEQAAGVPTNAASRSGSGAVIGAAALLVAAAAL